MRPDDGLAEGTAAQVYHTMKQTTEVTASSASSIFTSSFNDPSIIVISFEWAETSS